MSSASKPVSSTVPFIFWRYCSARRRRFSAAVSLSEEESSSEANGPAESVRFWGCSSSESEPDMESSRAVCESFAFGGLDLVGCLAVLRRFEVGAEEDSSFLFFLEAEVVKKEDMAS